VPLAYSIGGEELITLAIGSIFSGSIYGDHVSPISDTTIMASIFSGSDHIAHVKTQMPYETVTAAVIGAKYLLYNDVANVYVLLLIAVILQYIVIKGLTMWHEKKYPQYAIYKRALV